MKAFITEVKTNMDYNDHISQDITLKVDGMGIDARSIWGGSVNFGEYEYPEKAIVKCGHCGQWAARKTACHKCGAPVD